MTAATPGKSGFDIGVRRHRGKVEMLKFGSTGKSGKVTQLFVLTKQKKRGIKQQSRGRDKVSNRGN